MLPGMYLRRVRRYVLLMQDAGISAMTVWRLVSPREEAGKCAKREEGEDRFKQLDAPPASNHTHPP